MKWCCFWIDRDQKLQKDLTFCCGSHHKLPLEQAPSKGAPLQTGSEMYNSDSGCKNGIASVERKAKDATVAE